jgi:Ca2+-binding EF-hand superfamily protein
MNRPIVIACTACAALLVCVALPAADDNNSDSAPSSANSVNDSNAALFDRLDANHDGQITADEVPTEHRGLFERLLRRADSNGDGKLSREEFMQGLAADQPGPPATRSSESHAGGKDQMRESAKIREYAASIIKQYDTNGDGVLDKTEWSKLKNAERYDRNHDGKITLEEIIETMSASQPAVEDPSGSGRERMPMDGGLGSGGNGGFGRSDGFGGGGGMAGGGVGPFMGTALFRALDTNHDGKLDAKEIAAAADVLKKLANTSGEITREELLQSLPPGARPGAGGGGGRGGFGGLPGGGQAGANPNSPRMSFDQIVKMLDKNGDGKLQKDELPPFLQNRFEQLDTNHDGVLDESELKQFLPRLADQLQQRAEGRQGGERPRLPMPPNQN